MKNVTREIKKKVTNQILTNLKKKKKIGKNIKILIVIFVLMNQHKLSNKH